MDIRPFKLLIGLLLMTDNVAAGTQGQLLLTDFTPTGADLGWYVVNDNVMGGRSLGDFAAETQMLRFSGRTNTDGGGFSSIRTGQLDLDLSAYDGIRVRVKGDGRRYTWRIATDARWRGQPVGYWADFDTRDAAWITVDIPFARFAPKFRGYALDGPALDSRRVLGMGLMIYDKKDGPFELQLDSVHAYKAREPFALSGYRWKKRVLILSAPNGDDTKLRKQLDAVAATRDAFDERDMELVVVLDADGSAAGDRRLIAEEVAAVRTSLGIASTAFQMRLVGKDGSVKYSSGAPDAMSEIYALIDTMPMRRREQGP